MALICFIWSLSTASSFYCFNCLTQRESSRTFPATASGRCDSGSLPLTSRGCRQFRICGTTSSISETKITAGSAMRLVTYFMLFTSVILVSGCAGQSSKCDVPIARAGCAPGTAANVMMEHEQRLETIDDARCRSYGHKPQSPAYNKCRADLAVERSINSPPRR